MAAFDRWPVMVPRNKGNLLSDLVDLYQQYLRVHYRAPGGDRSDVGCGARQ